MDFIKVWNFSFTDGDHVFVKSSDYSNYNYSDFYTFTKNGEDFTSTTAEVTEEISHWYAWFPSEEIDLTNQDGKKESVANLFAMSGRTEEANPTTGEEGLNISMSAQVAILKIINKKGDIDLNVKTWSDTWVAGLKAEVEHDYSVYRYLPKYNIITSSEKTSLLSTSDKGTYYVVVPAGQRIQILDGERALKKNNSGLKAGKYYEITVDVPPVTSGSAVATINGVEQIVNWVQLWPDGPKFATKPIDTKITYTEAIKIGEDYIWGKNWRTPTQDELDNLKFRNKVWMTFTEDNNGNGICTFTGVNAGYDYSISLPIEGNYCDDYWTSTEYPYDPTYAYTLCLYYSQDKTSAGYIGDKSDTHLVIPVLNE